MFRKGKLWRFFGIVFVMCLFAGANLLGHFVQATNSENNIHVEAGYEAGDSKPVREKSNYQLTFKLRRPPYTSSELLDAVYYNYWATQADAGVLNEEGNGLGDFSIAIRLHVEGESAPRIQAMRHTTENEAGVWYTDLTFADIPIAYDKVEVEYISDGDSYFEPYLLEYDLYLKERDGVMVLQIPRIYPSRTDEYTGQETLFKVADISVDKVADDSQSQNLEAVYLDGQKGDDTRDGSSPDQAVRTFERARELATKQASIRTIFICGETALSGDISLEGTSAIIKRNEGYTGVLLKVPQGATASLRAIIIDGAKESQQANKSAIEVSNKAQLHIQEGAVIRNNQQVADFASLGGGIKALPGSSITMSGGEITGNEATMGGGVYLGAAKMTMTGGRITNNTALPYFDKSTRQSYGAGGGILIYNGSHVDLSGASLLQGNRAGEIGGAISVGNSDWSDNSNTLTMTGGVIDGNEAGSAGGGIFVQAELGERTSKAVIKAGQIINNRMTGTGRGNKAFGGGGIYVNGMPSQYGGSKWNNGELALYNALITDNTARIAGGGLAACPISKTKIFINEGAAIYQNKTNRGSGNDIYILSSLAYGIHSGLAEYKVPYRMMSGELYQWRYNDNQLLEEDRYEGTLKLDHPELPLHTETIARDTTKNSAKVIISGNTSTTRGGGIGSNGQVTIGTNDETTDIAVLKRWANIDDEEVENKPIEVELYRNDEATGEIITLNAANHWEGKFTRLPKTLAGEVIHYSVREVGEQEGKVLIGDEKYAVSYEKTGDKQYQITNTRVPQTINIPVRKQWLASDGQAMQPNIEKIEVLLYKNGEATNQTLTLNADNQWQGIFSDLPLEEDGREIHYTVKEAMEENLTSFQGGRYYLVSYLGDETEGYTIVNRLPELPNEPTINLRVKKRWVDALRADIPAKTDKIQVALYKNNQPTGIIRTLGVENDWQATFEDLPLDNKGEAVIYTVRELGETNQIIAVDGQYFLVEYEMNGSDEVTITNRLPHQPNKPGKPNKPNKPNKPGKPNKPNKPGKPNKPNKPGKPNKPTKPDKPSRPSKPKKPILPKTGAKSFLLAALLLCVSGWGVVKVTKHHA